MDHLGQENYKPNPVLEKALDVLFLLHADHELNASATTVLQTGSSLVDPYSTIAWVLCVVQRTLLRSLPASLELDVHRYSELLTFPVNYYIPNWDFQRSPTRFVSTTLPPKGQSNLGIPSGGANEAVIRMLISIGRWGPFHLYIDYVRPPWSDGTYTALRTFQRSSKQLRSAKRFCQGLVIGVCFRYTMLLLTESLQGV